MNPCSEDVKDMLESSAVGAGTYGTDLFISLMPPTPNACLAVFDTGGYDPQAGYDYERPTVQVRIRGEVFGYQAAWDKAKEVSTALHGLYNETWNGARYVGIWQQGDIIFMGYDDNNRPLLSLNFRIHRAAA